MLLIYFHENVADTEDAKDVAKSLRLQDIPCQLRNAGRWDKNQFERPDAILAINCDEVADAYEARNGLIRLAQERGDTAMYASTPIVEVFRDIDAVFAAVEGEDEPEASLPDISKMTIAQLHAFAKENEIDYPTSANKAELVATIREAMAKEASDD